MDHQQKESKVLFQFSLDLTLINILREFKHQNHSYQQGFIEKLYHLLSFFQSNQDSEIFDQYSTEKNQVSLKEIVLQTHIIFSSIDNLQELTTFLEDQTTISPINVKYANSTNILTVHSLKDLKSSINHEQLNKLQGQLKPNYLKNFKVQLLEDSTEEVQIIPKEERQELQLSYEHHGTLDNDSKEFEGQVKAENLQEKTNLSIKKKDEKEKENQNLGDYVLNLPYNYCSISFGSKGKLDLYETSYVCKKLNQQFGLYLHHIIFGFLRYEPEELILRQNIKNYNLNYSNQFLEICNANLDFKFDKETYKNYRNQLVSFRHKPGSSNEEYIQIKNKVGQFIQQIQTLIQNFIVCRNLEQQHYIEKMLIGMLGHPIKELRDAAVIALNIIYDGIDWQINGAMTVKVSNVGRKFQINYLVEAQYDKDIYIQLKSNIFVRNCKQSITSLHKPQIKEFQIVKGRRFVHVSIDLGRFQRCGFYDWRLIKIGEYNVSPMYKVTESENDLLTQEVKGRFIVHPQITRDLQCHEVFIDLQNGVQDEKSGRLTVRGNFKTITEALPEYKQRGVNCIYLMGALERDNGFQVQAGGLNQHNYHILRPDASPLAVTARDYPNSMMGGKEGFKEMTKKAQELGIKLVIDSLTRISSSRMHKKYRKYLLSHLDEQGKLMNVFGTDGRSMFFEDTCMLNYRKKKCWDMFLEEVVNFTENFHTQGIHLDNGQSWPQIFELDEEELYRKEVDGSEAYSEKEIFEGSVVKIGTESGYWGSTVRDSLPNPFLIKLCRHLWSQFPDFLIISEVWGSMGGFEDSREYTVIESGPIPRLFKFPLAIAQFFGKSVKKDGTISYLKERKNVSYFKKWYENFLNALPEGSNIIQSTTYHTLPYPALLYKRGTWAAVDLFFFFPDIPMTFIGEKEGKATKIKATNFFQTLKLEKQQVNEIEPEDSSSQGPDSPKSQSSLSNSMLLSSSSFAQNKQQKNYQRVDSAFFQTHGLDQPTQPVKKLGRTGSYVQLADVTQSNYEELNLVSQEGWGFIESLKGIKFHYEHRRNLRKTLRPLTRGQFIPLICELQFDSSTLHSHVLTFARYTKMETIIVGINFNDGPIVGKINFENLHKYFPDHKESDIVVELRYLIQENATPMFNVFFISELLDERFEIQLNGFESNLISFKVLEGTQENIQLAKDHSYQRLILNMKNEIPHEIQSNYTAMQLYQLVQKTNNLQEFIDGFSYLYLKYYKNLNLSNLISIMKPFKTDYISKNKIYAFFNELIKLKQIVPQIESKIPVYSDIKKMLEGNILGPICIATPEYGKYTKTGGLGVMTDELSRGLAELGEEVYVITPYYEDKRKKNPDMLEKDGIKYVRNHDFWIGGHKFVVGIFYGKVNGVHMYFLTNTELFPSAFCGEEANYITKQLVLYARSCLQILCDIKVIPSIIVTNDWFSGLIPAYVKNNTYGTIFQGTKIFHIAHNLDESYEGRMWPKHGEDYLQWLHELPYDLLVDRTWEKTIINPSRCAFLCCDNWGTVSHSYKYELLTKSPLRFILGNKPNAFSFPNGLNKQERLNMIIEKTGNDHLKAKEHLQKKYFGMPKLNNKIPLFGFVGRITEQKGVHLILDGMHQLIQDTNYKVQIILGGMANEKEPYAKECAEKIRILRQQYPNNFWGDPDLFFKDGPMLNSGCDFGLMPSKFEPGGIVQHEFFVASTPVVATKTGGLQDTVYEYNTQTMKGTGFVFSEHTWFHMVQAIKRAIKVFKDTKQYQQLRKNAFEGTIDVSDVSRAYAIEFYRMFNKNFLDQDLLKKLALDMNKTFVLEQYKPRSLIKKQKGIVLNKELIIKSRFQRLLDTQLSEHKQIHFKFKPPKGTFPRIVQIIGSFDDWNTTYDLKYDQFSREWKISLKLKPSDYQYKYKIDDVWMINPDEPQDQDQFMNINNVIRYEQFLAKPVHHKNSTHETLRKTSSNN